VGAGLFAGDRLPTQRDLARELQMSPSVVREALRELQAQHIVEARHGDGYYLKPYGPELAAQTGHDEANSPHAKEHLLYARAAVEQAAAERACLEATDAELDRIEEIVDSMAAAVRERVHRRDLDLEFHKSLVGCAHNPFLLRFSAVIADYFFLQGTERRVVNPGAVMALVEVSHRNLLAVLRRRNPADASAAVRLHVLDEIWRRP
jgi:GntR family transcriptional repressor for pyruvate dehydrogenase complex